MIDNFNYNGNCWWCGSIADSREHKQKKSDFIREFGRNPSNSTVIIKNEKEIIVQGPDSKHLKYEKPILCKTCNSETSQPFDLAWDKVLSYISKEANAENLIHNLDFRLINKIEYKPIKRNFLKYLVKHISCRLASNNLKVPISFLNYLNDISNSLEGLTIHAFYRADIAVLKSFSKKLHNDKYPFLFSRPINGFKNEDNDWLRLHSGITIGIIEFRYVIDEIFIENNFPGINAYNEYPYFPITKIWEPLSIFKDRMEIYNPDKKIPRLEDEQYLDSAYNKNFYEWFNKHK